MGTKYTDQSASSYDSTPPVDDGSVSESNKVKWSTIKTKLSDPLKTQADAISDALVTHFDNGPRALITNTTLGASDYGKVIQVSGSGVTLTLTDAASLTAGWYCRIINNDSSNGKTIARATGGDTINGSAANYTMDVSQGIDVVVNAAANGFLLRSFVINPVTTDTTQTISAAKTFSGATTFGATTFTDTSGSLTSSVTPRQRFTETDAAVDNKNWDILINSEQFRMRAYNDADSIGTDWIAVDRTGTTIDTVNFPNGTLQAGSVKVPTISSSDTFTNKTLTSPIVNSATGIGQALVKRKTADESVTSSTTLQDDDHLTFAIAANEEWVATFNIKAGINTLTTGMKVAITVPSGATLMAEAVFISDSSANVPGVGSTTSSGSALTYASGGSAAETAITIRVWVLNSSNAGNVTLQWAQQTSSGTALVFSKGSYLVAHRIA